MSPHVRGIPVEWYNVELLAIPLLLRPRLYTRRPSWWEPVDFCHILTLPTSLGLASYSKLVVDERPGTSVVWHLTAFEIVMMALVRFLYTSERGVVGFQCYDWQMVQCGCEVLFRLSAGVDLPVDHYSFPYFILGCSFDSSLANMAYR